MSGNLEEKASGLRILHVTNMWPDADAPHFGVFIKSQVISLQNAGVSCDVVKSNAIGFRKYHAIRQRVRQKIMEFKPDVIHAHFGWTGVAIVSICRKNNIPLLISYCGGDINGEAGTVARRLKHRIGVWLSLWVGKFAQSLIVKSSNMLLILPTDIRSKTTVLQNGVDIYAFRPLCRVQARKQLGWPDQPVVLFAGRSADPTKNFSLANQAAEISRETIPGLILKSAMNIPHDKMPLWINAADVVLLTSHREGSPNIIKEALACDIPVVSVPVGDVPVILDGLQGSCVVAYEPHAIANALISIISKSADFSGEGRNQIMKLHLDAPFVAARLISIYADIIARKV